MTAMTPHEIQNKTFDKKGMGGYKVDEVGAYLAEVAAYLRELEAEKVELEEKLSVLADKLEEYREDEDSLRTALLSAQKLANSVVRDAKRKAEMMLAEASEKAEELVNDAKSSIDREAVALTRIQGQVGEFKSQLLGMYKKHIEMIQSIPNEREIPSDVQVIVEQASIPKPPEPSHEEIREEPEFFVRFEEDTDEEVAGEQRQDEPAVRRTIRSDHGKLRFGEEYSLTRND